MSGDLGPYPDPSCDRRTGYGGTLFCKLAPGHPGDCDDNPPIHEPRRGSDVEAYIKARRDKLNPHASTGARLAWLALDDLLDDYRAHADTGTPINHPVDTREGQ